MLATAYCSRFSFHRIITLKTEVEAYKNSFDKACPECLNGVSRHKIIQPKTVAHALTFKVNIRDQIKSWLFGTKIEKYRSSDVLSSFGCRVIDSSKQQLANWIYPQNTVGALKHFGNHNKSWPRGRKWGRDFARWGIWKGNLSSVTWLFKRAFN